MKFKYIVYSVIGLMLQTSCNDSFWIGHPKN